MTKNQNPEMSREVKLFAHTPIWKSVLIMALPSMVMMLAFGSYFFFDSVLSINFASDSYKSGAIPGLDRSSMVRIFMNGYSPINSLMVAIGLMISIGVSTRVAINMGRGDIERAKNTLRTGFMVGMISSFVIAPILIFSAKPWIGGQYSAFSAESIQTIENESFKYALPIILTYPLYMFINILPSILRVEARNKQMLVIMIIPIFLNLLLDYVFMGPGGMGVEGGAYATVLANVLSGILLAYFISRSPADSLIRFNILFGFKFRIISFFGIMLVGSAPFLRNLAQSITSSVQNNIINDVSTKVFFDNYKESWTNITDFNNAAVHKEVAASLNTMLNIIKNKNPEVFKHIASSFQTKDINVITQGLIDNIHFNNWDSDFMHKIPMMGSKVLLSKEQWAASLLLAPQGLIHQQASSAMISIMSGAMPVFILFFPVMFSFAQAGRPIASFNYGAKNYKRVKQTYIWIVIYATIGAVIIYLMVSFGLAGPLISLLKVNDTRFLASKHLAKEAIKIVMLTMVVFSFAIGGMTVFGSTDRIFLSIIASSFQGLIIFWPIIFGFKELAINHPGNDLLFLWFWPLSGAISSIFITIATLLTIRRLSNGKQTTLDEKISKVYAWRNKRVEARKAKKV